LLPSFLISKIKRIKLIYDSHEYFTEVPELVSRPKVQKVWRAIEEFVLPKMKEMITVNESIANLFREKYGIKVHVIRNIPMRKMLPEPSTREALNIPADKHILILQGSGINIHRGSEELVDAMQYLDNCILLIIGGGDVLPLLKKKVEENHWDDRVRFYPRMPYRDMMAITRLAEIGFTLDKANNLNYLFSLPNKLFDYIQANVPIIASHLPEIERIIRDYNIGTFVDDHNPQHIAEKIKETLSDENALKTWKNNLNFAAQELCWENEEKTLIEIYEQYI
jgi:glycosyltransferase involved in cell wall biosynthesis